MRRWLATAGALAALCVAAGAERVCAQDLEAGRALYENKCAQCHGANGDGAGVAAERLMPRPRDFTAGSFKIRTTPSGELPTDPDLFRVIRRGMPHTAMPAWPQLSDAQVDALVAYVKTFNPDFDDPEMIVPPLDIPDPPPLTEESVRRGRTVYEENKCFECHGQKGRTDGESAPTLTDDTGAPIPPADLTRRWTFRGGAGRADIYRTFTTGLDGTPMPSYADSIGEEQRWQLVDYVYSLSQDEPSYSSLVIARHVEEEIEVDPKSPVFDAIAPTLLPTVGQVTDPGRLFAPATNAVELRAVYNADVLALQVSWHAMLGQRAGSNRPDGHDLPPEDAVLSDAVAVQLPTTPPEGPAKPYFLYGDPAHSVDLAFYDAAADAATAYVGKGAGSLAPALAGDMLPTVRAKGVFEEGLWQVVFVWPRRGADGAEDARFAPATFLPIALSVWSGPARETGSRRAITSWYPLYIDPPETGAAYVAAGTLAAFTLVAQLLVVAGVRRARRDREP
jgi:DMSO reductase family type II enzyme heme b subunit